jgi:hypothetical protein
MMGARKAVAYALVSLKNDRRMAIRIYRSDDERRTWRHLSEIGSPNQGLLLGAGIYVLSRRTAL